MRVKFPIFLLLCVTSLYEATGCTCFVTFDFEKCDKVLIGEILKVDTVFLDQTVDNGDSVYHYDLSMNKYTVSVIETFKGKQNEKQIYIYSGYDGYDCGYTFSLGKTYIVYATNNHMFSRDNLPSGPLVYYTSGCSETIHYNKEHAEFLRKLK